MKFRLIGALATVCSVCVPVVLLGNGAEITSPTPGSKLVSSSVLFHWTAGSGEKFLLFVGTEGLGSSDIFESYYLPSETTSLQVEGIPTNRPVNVRLWCQSRRGAPWYASDYNYNSDLDSDGILDIIDSQVGFTDPMLQLEGSDHRLTILGSERLVSIESQILFNETNTEVSLPEARALSRRVYEHFQDDFDFLIFASNQPDVPSGSYFGKFFGAQNSIDGIGKGRSNTTSSFGSDGQLQGVIHLTSSGGLRGGPSLHELAHNWANSMKSIPTAIGAHWGFSNIGGQLGGWQAGSLVDLGNNLYQARNPRSGNIGSWGSFANGGNALPYSDLELYTMGLIEPSDVKQNIKIANDFAWSDREEGIFSASSITTRSMEQVISIDGPRIPRPSISQKEFRTLYVLLTDRPLTLEEWQNFDQDVYNFQLPADDAYYLYNFWEATRGLATLSMDHLTSSLINTPDIAPRLQNLRFTDTVPPSALVDIDSDPGFVYQLEYSSDLMIWHRGEEKSGTGSAITFASDTAGVSLRFFRVVRSQP
jgi:hypothetical protein